MHDLKNLLDPLSAHQMPDVWEEIQRRTVVPMPEPRRSRIPTFAVSLAIALLVALIVITLTPLSNTQPTPIASGGSHYSDPSGWTADYPSAWTVTPIPETSDGLGAGATISNVDSPRPDATTTVALTVAHGVNVQPDSSLSPTALPLSVSDFKPAPGGSNMTGLDFVLGGIRYEATLRVGPSASPSDVTAMSAVIASIRPSSEAMNPVAFRFAPSEVAFWDASRGLIAGDESCDACEGAVPGGAVQLTDDGGRTWKTVLQGSPVLGLATYGTVDAWVTTSTGIWRTTDAGSTWSKVSTFVVIDPTFSSPTQGWAAVPLTELTSRLVETTDGGASWTSIPSSCRGSVTGLSPSALSTRVFFLVALSQTGSGRGTALCSNAPTMGRVAQGIFATTDDGKTWTQVWAGYDALSGMQILPSGFGGRWTTPGNTFETTTNSGRSWTDVGTLPDETYSLWLVSDTDAVAITSSGGPYHLVTTSDGGSTWLVVASFAGA